MPRETKFEKKIKLKNLAIHYQPYQHNQVIVIVKIQSK